MTDDLSPVEVDSDDEQLRAHPMVKNFEQQRRRTKNVEKRVSLTINTEGTMQLQLDEVLSENLLFHSMRSFSLFV